MSSDHVRPPNADHRYVTSPPSPWDAVPDLIGRGREMALLTAFLDRALDGGASLLLHGDAGSGKTALLRTAAGQAATRGMCVLAASGVEFEAEIPYAGLHQLLSPLLGSIDADLGPLHQEALSIALGLRRGLPPDRLVVSSATLLLLRAAAAAAPLLITVDDVPWLDRASAAALGFLARRVSGTRIGFLATARTGAASFFERTGLAQHELGPLDEPAATELVATRFPDLAPRARQRVVAEALGNPLALVELPLALSHDQRTSGDHLPGVLPLTPGLQQVYAGRIAGLPGSTRRLLLLLALDGSGSLDVLAAAAHTAGWLDELAPAEAAGLVQVDTVTGTLAFRHPLIGSAAVGLSTAGERRQAHRSLADALVDQPERRAWHLSESAVGKDETAAHVLTTAARAALDRGDGRQAVTALLRAAELSPRGADRARRLAEAAYVATDVTGELARVPALLREAKRADPAPATAGGVARAAVATAYHLLNGDGEVDTAHALLVGAITQPAGTDADDDVVAEALHSLLLVCYFSGRDEPWRIFDEEVARRQPRVPAILSTAARTFADPARATMRDLADLRRAQLAARDDPDPTQVVRLGIAAFFVDRLPDSRDALLRIVEDGRHGGAVASAANALLMLCHGALVAGHWADAQRLAEEGIELCREHGYRLIAWPGWHCLAVLAAARGQHDDAEALAEQMTEWAAPRGAGAIEHFGARARGLAALGRADHDEAYRQLSAVSPPGSFPRHVPMALWVAMDLVEAAVRVDRPTEARRHAAAMQRIAAYRASPRLRLLAAGAAALVAGPEDAAATFQRALAVPGADRAPFELARIRLAYGEHLRRARSPSAARDQLSTALSAFEALGATPWAGRAATELRATGLIRSPAHRLGVGALTPQERQIADLAASGLSNREIGARLHLSHRTVGAHLYRVYPKLGVGTRAALRDALAAPALGAVRPRPAAAPPALPSPPATTRGL